MSRILPAAAFHVTTVSALAGVVVALSGCGWDDPTAHAATVAASAAAAVVPSTAAGAKPAAAPTYEKAFYTMMATRRLSIPAMAVFGKALFFDPTLSTSGKQACVSCHNPTHTYGPPSNLSVQLGGADVSKTGMRTAPSLRYLQEMPPFSEHFYESDGNDSEDQGPIGGYTQGGRTSSAHDQACIPLLSRHKMANDTQAAVVAKLHNDRHAQTFRQVFGNDILDDEDVTFRAALIVLEAFRGTPSEFYPYDSKYDTFLHKQVKLSA